MNLPGFLRDHPWRWLWLLLLIPVVACASVVMYVTALIPAAPSIADIQRVKPQEPTVVLSEDGQQLALFRRKAQEWVKLSQVSPHVVDALLATEDRRFYEHHGLDLRRTIKAAWSTMHGDLQGGSTISQQLARNLFPDEIGRAPTIERKVKEAITAVRIEKLYPKERILEMYLNTVPFLYNAWGIEMAARTYFDKPASELDVLQSATLIGMLKGTRYYNPVLNPERAVQRRNLVLAQLVSAGKLASGDYERLKREPLGLDFERQDEDLGPAPHLAQQIKTWLVGWADKHGYNIYADGLVVHTTIDSRLQRIALDSLARQADKLQAISDKAWEHRPRNRKLPQEDKPRLEAAFVAEDPSNGHVKAWVGSRDFARDQFDHVQQARRQPGSTFKPFVYGAAFDMGISPTELVMDEAPEILLPDGKVWKPSDVHEATGLPTTLRDGLVYSKNAITAQLIERVGAGRVADLARAMGVRQSKLDVVPSLALGTSPVTLKEMVSSYCTIADQGSYIEPIVVLSVENRKHQVLEQFHPPVPEQALRVEAAQTLLDVMRGVIDRGTGAGIRSRFGLRGDLAGKTGTTQDNTDGWFILMHPQLVAGAWVGFNDQRITMGNSWGQGAHNALNIVGDFFQNTTKAKLVDAKAKFAAPHDTSEPDPDVLAQMMAMANGGLQPASDTQPAIVDAPAVGTIVISPPTSPDPRGYVVIPTPPPSPPAQGGIRILRAY
ncbi:MAG TPA: transglycosylase domain-containing protein [Ramlibacter sp.]|nr:transglycosylase domain-containing protein [Ramlibacter sp.]